MVALTEIFSTSLQPMNGIQLNLDRDHYFNVFYPVCVFRLIWNNQNGHTGLILPRYVLLLVCNHLTEFNKIWQEARSQRPQPLLYFSGFFKTKMAALASDRLRHFFYFFSATDEQNSMKLDRKQALNGFFQICVFCRANLKSKITTLAADWQIHWLLSNCWTEFNETWKEVRNQRHLPFLCFSGWSKNQDGQPGLWLTKTFLTTSLQPPNIIQWNSTKNITSMSSTPSLGVGWGWVWFEKPRLLPWPLMDQDMFFFSSVTAEWNSTRLDSKQDLNVLYQVCVFGGYWKIKMAILASIGWNTLIYSLHLLNRIQWHLTDKIFTSCTKFVFLELIGKPRWPPWPLMGRDIFLVILCNWWTEINET